MTTPDTVYDVLIAGQGAAGYAAALYAARYQMRPIVLDRQLNGSDELTLDGLFIEIGADPRAKLASQLGLELNELNEIKVDKIGRTSVHGVFAAGDVTDASGDLKQTITAASQGAVAATAAYEHFTAHGNACAMHAVGFSLA